MAACNGILAVQQVPPRHHHHQDHKDVGDDHHDDEEEEDGDDGRLQWYSGCSTGAQCTLTIMIYGIHMYLVYICKIYI